MKSWWPKNDDTESQKIVSAALGLPSLCKNLIMLALNNSLVACGFDWVHARRYLYASEDVPDW